MEIRGFIKSKHLNHIRIVTSEKEQEIDVFYTEMRNYDVEELLESEQIILDVKIQSTDYYGLKLGKFWMSDIVFPKKNYEYRKKPKKRERDQVIAQQQFIDRTK